MNIAESCFRKSTVTLSLAAALMVAGVLSYFKLGRLEDPEFTIRSAQVVAQWPGATAEEVAERVTDQLETAVQRLGRVDHVTSVSSPGMSIITVDIRDTFGKEELPQIWDELRRKVSDAASGLPDGCSAPVVNDDYGDVYGVLYAIHGDGFSLAELKDHAKLLRRELLLCDDVSKVDILGDRQEIVSLEISRAKVANLGITPQEIAAALRGWNVPADAGRLQVGDRRIRLTPGGAVGSVKDIEGIVLNTTGADGKTDIVYLGDVARVTRDYVDPPQCIVRYDGKPSVALGISTAKGGNVLKMGASVERRMRELLPETPIGIEIGVISHQAKSVDAAVSGFIVNLVESVLIVIAVLLITMGLRSGILIGGVLLLTVMATVAVMDLMGIMFERISLGAFIIALGMLVDNAIVICEAVLVAANRGESRKDAAVAVVRQTVWPLLGATVIAILSFAPVGASQDSSGEYCRSLFLVIGISLLLSWVFAITVTPILAAKFLKGSAPAASAAASDPYGGLFFRLYRRFLEWCLAHVGVTWAVLGLMVAAAVVGFGRVARNFFPDSTRPQFMVHVWMPEGVDIKATDAVVRKLTDEVKGLEGVTGVSSVTGGGALRFLLTYSPESPNPAYGVLFVDVDDYTRIPALMEKVEAAAPALAPDAMVSCQRFVLGPGDAQKIQLRLMGPEPAVLRDFGERVLGVFRSCGGLKEIQSDWRNRAETIEPVVNKERARKLGLARADIAVALKANTDGNVLGSYLEGTETLPIVLRAPKKDRENPDSIGSSWMWCERLGVSVPFAQVVDGMRCSSEENHLARRDRLPCLTVKCNPRDGETADAALSRIMPKVEEVVKTLPAGFRAEWGGEYENSNKANEAIGGKLLPIFAIMALVVLSLFNSVRQTLVIFMTLPLIVIGVVAGLLTFGQPFGFMALLGFLSLVGMQVKNAIVLMDEINARLAAGDSPYQAVVSAGVSRVRPVANSALTTVLGMLPLIADAFYAAMAVTIMFGLAFATVLTMIVVPVNYILVFRVKRMI